MVEITSAITKEHCIEIASDLNHPNIEPYMEATGRTKLEMIERMLGLSPLKWSIFIDGDLVGIAGLKAESLMESQAECWIFASSLVKKHPVSFLRAMRSWSDQCSEKYPRLIAHIDDRFEESLKMARAMGFKYEGLLTGSGLRCHLMVRER
jgi:RimJ/RimL family protein N-acetyltransferase